MPRGSLHIFVGPMFSGKTSRLIDALQGDEEPLGVAFLPEIDNRSKIEGRYVLLGHDGRVWPGHVQTLPTQGVPLWLGEVYGRHAEQGAIIAFDEVQFLDSMISPVLRQLADMGGHIVATGLLRDSRRKPWETTLAIMGLADRIETILATCAVCKKEWASDTWRNPVVQDRVAIGNGSIYEPRCVDCWRE